MKLILLRHAESHGNATGIYSTEEADSLSSKGMQQAELVADKLSSHAFDKIIVSPTTRTLQTIAPFLEAADLQGEVWPEITEACWHDEREAAAASWRARDAALPDEIAHLFYFRDNKAIRPDYLESFAEGLCRIREALERVESFRDSGQTLLMVCHGHFIREFLNLVLKPAELTEYHHDNCGMTMLHWENNWQPQFINAQEL